MTEPVTITRSELDRIVREAMDAGAKEMRAAFGLPADEDKAREFISALHEARSLIEAWRDTKRTVRQTAVKWATMLLLGFMALSVGYGLHDKFK